ncbi:hypothetical protein NC658_32945 [Streptomyces griseoincarnatus]|uniref:Uncharacterized protein n=1 Tax=Streptomyces griseoincarnatus TaxID=29305 RepID=A0ABT0W340_STRGI|nr:MULTISPECIES: hypothetical protein [Streptomyces]MBJ6613790.1 hypothetical protein [Streptomyces sp. I3(2020)]MBJ6628858.1 hypothetical protein [Streptomyces sp. I4(2020)]MCM2517996.1 hypothetical protein [Streptomyces griseoincarnatus]
MGHAHAHPLAAQPHHRPAHHPPTLRRLSCTAGRGRRIRRLATTALAPTPSQDKTTVLTGIDPDEVNRQQYAQWIRNHVQPYLPDLDILELTDGTKTVLVVDVPASEMAPHFVYGGAARDKEQQTVVVPYRDDGHTAWMAEHQIERAYRDRFARVGQTEEEIQRHIDFTTQTITAHAYAPRHGSSRSPGLSGPCRGVPTR